MVKRLFLTLFLIPGLLVCKPVTHSAYAVDLITGTFCSRDCVLQNELDDLGRVVNQWAPVGVDATLYLVASYEYGENWTEFTNAFGVKTHYFFDPSSKLLLEKVEMLDDIPYRRWCYQWDGKQCVEIILMEQDTDGLAFQLLFDDHGYLDHLENLNTGQMCDFVYDSSKRLIQRKMTLPSGENFTYDDQENVEECLPQGALWKTVHDETLSKAHILYSVVKHNLIQLWNYNPLRSVEISFESFGTALMGQTMFEISGYYQYNSQNGIFEGPNGEIDGPCRLTYINGILNSRETLERACHIISRSHGGVNVHYSFRGSGGWANDLFRSIQSKLGYISEEAENLAQLWRELIDDMGGVKSGGVIIHYAHSIGGTETVRAKELLTPEEQKMIRVITFGSASLISDDGFQSVCNVVSIRDGVCWLDPLQYIRALLYPNSSVLFVGSHSDGAPMIDHMFDDYWCQWETNGWNEIEHIFQEALFANP